MRMNEKLQQFLENIIPFLVIGVAIALLVGLLFMFSYILVWGILIGGVLWLINLGKEYLFPNEEKKKDSGRIIEHDDKK